MLWGGLVAASVAASVAAIAAALGPLTSPERPVRDYLAALAADDLVTAAALAGLDAADLEGLGGMPLGDAGSPDVVEIVRVAAVDARTRLVTARYGERGVDVVDVAFVVRAAPLGPFTRWVLSEPPVAELAVRADRHDEVVVAGERLPVAEPGAPVIVTAFVPARVEARIDDPSLDAAPARARLGDGTRALELAVVPSARLERAVAREIEAFLDECVAQRVLQPAGCPFGIVVPDRLLAEPRWRASVPPVIAIVPGGRPGEWLVEGGATVRVALTVQRLIDGVVLDRDEAVVAVIRGSVALGVDGATLTIDPPQE